MRRWRFAVVFVVVSLLACPPHRASGQLTPAPTPVPATVTPPVPIPPPVPVLRLGALLPLTGPGAWFGIEIKRGLDLAALELKAPVPKPPPGAPGSARPPTSASSAVTPPAESPPSDQERARADAAGEPSTPEDPAGSGTDSTEPGAPKPKAPPDAAGSGAHSTAPGVPKSMAPPAQPVEPLDRPRTASLTLQALDVQPLDVRAAGVEMNRLLASGVTAVVTASPTPTMTAYPLATARDVLLVHAGLPTDRLPATSRHLLLLRPSVGARAEVLAAHVWALGTRRLALLAGGDDFGRAVRAGAAGRWRKQGGSLVHEESLSLDATDLRSRLRPVARSAPEAIVLGYQGSALGEAAIAIRKAGYAGRLLAVDDDRAALLAAGPALDGALILSDAFVPVPGTRGARFARSYESRHGQPPSRFAASAYETAVLLADAVPPMLRGGGLSGGRLRDVLVGSRRYPSLYAGNVRVREDGTLVRPLTLFRVEEAKLSFDDYVDADGRALGVPKPMPEPTAPPRFGFLPG